MKIVIWGGWYGSRNIGDRLLLLTISEMLKSLMGSYELTVLSAKPEFVFEYFNKEGFSKIRVVKPGTQILRLLLVLISCDLFIFGGGVPFFDVYKQSMRMFFITTILRTLRKPYYLWCVASYKIIKVFNKKIYKSVLNGASKITCRDQFTREMFLELGTHKDPQIVVDPAFALEAFDYREADRLMNKYMLVSQHGKLFALTPRTLWGKNAEALTHYTEKSKKDIQNQIEVYSIALDWLVDHGYTPVFIPMNTYSPDDDREVSRQIIGRSIHGENAVIIDEMIMPRVAPALYSQFQASLVSRVHGSVTSYLGNCPPIMYAFESKHVGIMESMSLSKQVYDVKSKPEMIIPLLEYVVNHRDEICNSIMLEKQILANKARVPLSYIGELLNK